MYVVMTSRGTRACVTAKICSTAGPELVPLCHTSTALAHSLREEAGPSRNVTTPSTSQHAEHAIMVRGTQRCIVPAGGRQLNCQGILLPQHRKVLALPTRLPHERSACSHLLMLHEHTGYAAVANVLAAAMLHTRS
jgi:hypothetical protein